ncbi:MAG: hypothetical protein IJS01_15445 [Lentisphaeria bacterium]|nr:hypothetical protein [Lentisphaeria bacterium]
MKKTMLRLASALVLAALAGCASFEEIKARADGGDPDMLYRVGLCYRDGDKVPANADAAYDYFKKAADGGSFAGAVCYAKEAVRRKDISEPGKFLERLQRVFTEPPRNSDDRQALREMQREYPKLCIQFAGFLKNADAGMELVKFKEGALRYFSRDALDMRGKYVAQYAAKLKSVHTKKELAEAKRLAEEKRIADEKRKAEAKRLADEKRATAEKAWAEMKKRHPGEEENQYKNRIYKILRMEADCPPNPGETPDEWQKRAERRRFAERNRGRRARTLDEHMAESRRQERRIKEQRAADQRYYAAKQAFDGQCEEEKRRAEEERRKLEAEKRRVEAKKRLADAKKYVAEIEERLKDSIFKYPYAKQISGIELHKGVLSGASRKWLASKVALDEIKKFLLTGEKVINSKSSDELVETMQWISRNAIDRDIVRAEEKLWEEYGFSFDKQHGVLHSVSFSTNWNQEMVAKKIEEYKKKYPNLKHSRQEEQDEKEFSHAAEDGMATGVLKWTNRTDTLESERVKITITSKILNHVDVTLMVEGLSKLEKRKLAEELKKGARTAFEMHARVNVEITDKVMKKYFETLKKK